ncbi:MAG TPA: isoprenylcysteine carboxylmethyltransferase family protein [Acetobacteraceae bacterium]|nr:isoprenylcysteine carboxylmethyltransferase family protein [Acetobacteraceae bacterium]
MAGTRIGLTHANVKDDPLPVSLEPISVPAAGDRGDVVPARSEPRGRTSILRDPAAFLTGCEGIVRYRETIFRATAVLATTFFVVRASYAVAANPWRVTLVLILLSECLATALLLLSTPPKNRDLHPVAVICAFWSYIYVGFLATAPGYGWLNQGVGVVLCSAGILLTISGLLAIGTSFGLLPATREIVRSGPYRFIRHPIYVGYFITHVGFILTGLSVQNVAVLASLYICQFVRVTREEKLLRQGAAYRSYCRDVPYRFVYRLI